MREAALIPILTYHGFVRNKEMTDGLYTLGEETFRAQMAYLAEHGFHVISLKETLGKSLPEKPVVITFDDGMESDFTVASPILKHHRFVATFFVNPGTLDRPGYLSTDRLRQMHREGMEIGSHGFNHLFLTRLDDKTLRYQIIASKKKLEAILENPVSFFSVPRGRYNRRILDVAQEAGYLAVCTSDIGFNSSRSEPFRLQRWAMKRSYTVSDFASIVEGHPKTRLRLKVRLKQAAHRLLGHTLYEAARNRILGEAT